MTGTSSHGAAPGPESQTAIALCPCDAQLTAPPYDALPLPLRTTLLRSWTAYHNNTTNPDGFWSRNRCKPCLSLYSRPRCCLGHHLSETLRPEIVNLFAMIYEGITALPGGHGVWDNIDWILNSWIGTSMGFSVRYRDLSVARRFYDHVSCRESRELSWYFHSMADTWRLAGPTVRSESGTDEVWGLHGVIADRRGESHLIPACWQNQDESTERLRNNPKRTLAYIIAAHAGSTYLNALGSFVGGYQEPTFVDVPSPGFIRDDYCGRVPSSYFDGIHIDFTNPYQTHNLQAEPDGVECRMDGGWSVVSHLNDVVFASPRRSPIVDASLAMVRARTSGVRPVHESQLRQLASSPVLTDPMSVAVRGLAGWREAIGLLRQINSIAP